MILLAHMLFGAAIGALLASNPILAITLAFLGHYFLDAFPHIEYSIDNIRHKIWGKALPDISKVILDFALAIFCISLLSENHPIIYICALVTLIPDALTIINDRFPNVLLGLHDHMHTRQIHYLTKQKNFPVFWKIFTQAVAIIASVALLVMFR